jgi:hypothetical protein
MRHENLAADALSHWLDNTGTPFEVSPAALITADPRFAENVDADVQAGISKGGVFETGWVKNSSINRDELDMTRAQVAAHPQLQDYFFAMNGYQYRVYGHEDQGSEAVTVQLFKRYNWGNPAGGHVTNNLMFPQNKGYEVDIPQNTVASLNADDMAEDFNMWGSYSLTWPGSN